MVEIDTNSLKKYKSQYISRQKTLKIVGIVLLSIGTGLLVAGISMMVIGDQFFGINSELWWNLSTGGGATTFIGAGCLMFGGCMFAGSRQNTMVRYIKQKMELEKLQNDEGLIDALKEVEDTDKGDDKKVIIKEIVKIRCQYCKTLVDVTEALCPNCGASL